MLHVKLYCNICGAQFKVKGAQLDCEKSHADVEVSRKGALNETTLIAVLIELRDKKTGRL
jgi:hypothetical protein